MVGAVLPATELGDKDTCMKWIVEILDTTDHEVRSVTVVAKSATAAGLAAVRHLDRRRYKVEQVEEAGRWTQS